MQHEFSTRGDVLYAAVDPVQVELRRRCRYTHISATFLFRGEKGLYAKKLCIFQNRELTVDRFRGYMSAHYSHTGMVRIFLSWSFWVMGRDHLGKRNAKGSVLFTHSVSFLLGDFKIMKRQILNFSQSIF